MVCDYKNYITNSNSGIYCYFDCLRSVLNYYRQDNVYSDKDLFLLFNGNNLSYKPREYIGYNIFSFEEFEYIKDVCFFCSKEEGIEQFETCIINSIKINQPLICCVNSRGLLYNQIYTKNANQMHFILIIGIDNVTKQVLIHDIHLRISNEKVIDYIGEMDLQDLYKTLIFSQSISRNIMDILTDRMPSVCEVLQEYLGKNHKIITSYLEDVFNELFFLSMTDNIRLWCLKINYDLKINGPCYLLKYYYLLTDSALFAQLDSEWMRIGNELLIYGQRGEYNCFKINALWEKVKSLQKEQRVKISQYLNKHKWEV